MLSRSIGAVAGDSLMLLVVAITVAVFVGFCLGMLCKKSAYRSLWMQYDAQIKYTSKLIDDPQFYARQCRAFERHERRRDRGDD
jgi:hypothetical protein